MNHQLVRYDITLKIRAYSPVNTVQESAKDRATRPQPHRPEALEGRSQEPPRADGDLSYTQFWAEARELFPDMKAPAIRQALGVDTMKAWVAQGKTLTSALELLKDLTSGETILSS